MGRGGGMQRGCEVGSRAGTPAPWHAQLSKPQKGDAGERGRADRGQRRRDEGVNILSSGLKSKTDVADAIFAIFLLVVICVVVVTDEYVYETLETLAVYVCTGLSVWMLSE